MLASESGEVQLVVKVEGKTHGALRLRTPVLISFLIVSTVTVVAVLWWPRAVAASYRQLGAIALNRGKVELRTNPERGQQLLRQAERYYLQALRWDGTDTGAYVKLGAAYLTSGRVQAAMDYLTRATELDPGDRQAWLWLGIANAQMGRPHLAAEQLGRAGSLGQLVVFGNRYLDAGDYGTASNIFRTAVKVRPGVAFPYLKVAEAEEVRGNTREAIAAYRSFIELEKENLLQKYLAQARLAFLEKRWPDVVASYQRALELASVRQRITSASSKAAVVQVRDDPEVRFSLGIAYHELGRLDEALRELQEAVRLGPESKWYYRRLADVYFDKGRYRESLTWYRKVLQMDPADWRATEQMRALETLRQ